MYRVYYDKQTGIINHMVKSRNPQMIEDDRLASVDFEEKPELYQKKIDIETQEIIELGEVDTITFPQARPLE